MRIATYNAAGIRPRVPLLLDWISEYEPDVLAIQETKVEDDKFPRGEFEELGYHLALHGQKSWNGVAMLSKSPISNARCGFLDELFPQDCRVLTCEIDGVTVINTYVPNGSSITSDKFEYKLRWLERFDRYLREHFRPTDKLIWLGDINIAPKSEDVYNPKRFFGQVGHHPEEFARLDRIKEFGLTDVFRQHHPEPGYFTYWDFVILTAYPKNFGWRIDHIYATEPLARVCEDCLIDRAARGREKPSDHTFVFADFDI
ncbi:MAG TPA: exodeoxyribonuclease III [Fimbriimonas sp.]|nr:exodeoxyribonuclease III [Fimbriimonas sp.]